MNNKIYQIILCKDLTFKITEVTIYNDTNKTYQALDKFNIKLCIQKNKIFDVKNPEIFNIESYKYYYIYQKDLEKFIYFFLKRTKEAITILRKDTKKFERKI